MARHTDPVEFHRQQAWQLHHRLNAAMLGSGNQHLRNFAIQQLRSQLQNHVTAGQRLQQLRSVGARGTAGHIRDTDHAGMEAHHRSEAWKHHHAGSEARARGDHATANHHDRMRDLHVRRGMARSEARANMAARAAKGAGRAPRRSGGGSSAPDPREHASARHVAAAHVHQFAARQAQRSGNHAAAQRHTSAAQHHTRLAGANPPVLKRGRRGGMFYISSTGSKHYV